MERYGRVMSTDPRAALDRLFAAFAAHLNSVAAVRDDEDPSVIAAADALMDAFDTYDEALYDAYEVDTPFVIYDGDDDDDDDDEWDGDPQGQDDRGDHLDDNDYNERD